ncbi:MAG: PorV/PorQ family protein [Bacteroidetes bacterium]|nr:PorV/PorQ family protein [Bacteroidota bacterium]MCH8522929.1 PorV/PorQ family protein [Balneolales bacterium]
MQFKQLSLNLAKVGLILFMALVVSAEPLLAQRSLIPSLGNSRSGTSGFQYLKINVDARSAAMAGSNIADASDVSALYLNPALAVQRQGNQFYLAHTAYFADISMNYIGYVHRHRNFAFGGAITYLDSGSMEETTEFNPFGTGRTFRTIHMAAQLTMAQELTNLFSYGVSIKYLDERVEEIQSQTTVVDIGFFYRVGDTGLRFAIGLNNFGIDATPSGETERQTLDGRVIETEFEDVGAPTTFSIGAAFDAYRTDNLSVLVTGAVINPSDNAERFSVGTELGYMNMFYTRLGYEFGVDEASLPSFGVGFKLPVLNYGLGVDYGFSTRDRLGSLHRIALKFNF